MKYLPEQFDNLILDETRIERISDDDKAYLEQFVKLEQISLIDCALQTLENFPKIDTLTKVSREDQTLVRHLRGAVFCAL